MIIGICGVAGAGKDLGAQRLTTKHNFVRVAFADSLKRYAKDMFDFTDDQLWGPSEMRNLPDKRYPRRHTWKEQDTWDGVLDYMRGTDAPSGGFSSLSYSCACCGQKARKRLVEDDLYIPDEEDVEPCYLTCRYALQLLGTEYGRHCYPDILVDYAIRVAKALKGGGCYYDMKRGLGYVSYVDSPGVLAKTDVVISDVRYLNEIRGIHRGGGYVIRIKLPKPKESGETWRKHPSEMEQEAIPDSEFDAVILNEKNGVGPFWADIDRVLTKFRLGI